MKIHFLPPLPPAPPAPPPKAPKTAFEIELATQELIRTAEQQRAHRIKHRKFPADRRYAGSEGADAPPPTDDDARAGPSDDEVDFTV